VLGGVARAQHLLVELADAVPKTSVGKFDKKVLRARYAAEHPAQS